MGATGARSSTASHYASNYETASAGFSEHAFYQVILDNNLSHAAWWEWVVLAILAWATSRWVMPLRGNLVLRLVAWSAVGIVCVYALPHLTVIPLLTTVVYTRTTYPWAVVVPHCIVAHATFRSIAVGPRTDRLQALVLSFFLFGFGGSVVADLFMGVPVTALAHGRIIPSHVLGWIIVWLSPGDVVYRIWKNDDTAKSNVLRSVLLVAEAIDAVTTPFGRMARAARELRNVTTAPLVAGVVVGSGGAGLRWLSGYGSWEAVEAAIYKSLGYCLLFGATVVWPCAAGAFANPEVHHCQAYNGSDLWRVSVVSLHVLWTLLVDAGIVTSHPFVWGGRQLGKQTLILAQVCRLGPSQPTSHEKQE